MNKTRQHKTLQGILIYGNYNSYNKYQNRYKKKHIYQETFLNNIGGTFFSKKKYYFNEINNID
jgi:hypothetical protein